MTINDWTQPKRIPRFKGRIISCDFNWLAPIFNAIYFLLLLFLPLPHPVHLLREMIIQPARLWYSIHFFFKEKKMFFIWLVVIIGFSLTRMPFQLVSITYDPCWPLPDRHVKYACNNCIFFQNVCVSLFVCVSVCLCVCECVKVNCNVNRSPLLSASLSSLIDLWPFCTCDPVM